MKNMVGSFKLYGSQKTIRYKNYDGVWYFVYDDIYDYIKLSYHGEKELYKFLNLIDSKYIIEFKPDESIHRNEAYLIGTQQEDVPCVSKFGIKSILEIDDFYNVNKLLTLIEYLDKNF